MCAAFSYALYFFSSVVVRALCYLLVDLVWPADKPKNKLIRLDDDDEEEFDEVPGIDFLCNFVQSEVWSCRLYLGNQRKSDGMALCVSEHIFFVFWDRAGLAFTRAVRTLYTHFPSKPTSSLPSTWAIPAA